MRVDTRASHPAAVLSLHVTLVFLRKCSLIASVCCAARPPAAAPSCPASAEPPVLLELPVVWLTMGGDWPMSAPWLPPGFLGDLGVLALRLFWHQIPPSKTKKAIWLSILISNVTKKGGKHMFISVHSLLCSMYLSFKKIENNGYSTKELPHALIIIQYFFCKS